MRRPSLIPVVAASVVVASILAAGAFASPEDSGPPGGMPAPQKKIDHPFATALPGEWSWTAQSSAMGESKGTSTIRLGLLDTAVIEDVRGTTKMGPFEGQALWRVGADGTSVKLWWFSNLMQDPEVFTGKLGSDGYEVSSPAGGTMALRKTATGLEMKAAKGPNTMTVTYTKK
jgi:hypothetical protein